MAKQLNEHMYLVVRSLKHGNDKIDYVMQRGDIIKLGRIKFAVKEINIVEETMEVDESNHTKVLHKHANYEAVNDEEFFEFQEVECHFNDESHGINECETNAKSTPVNPNNEEVPSCRFCWSS
jgi:hypothetical protein